MTAILSSSSSSLRASLAELRGYAILTLCLGLSAAFVAEVWHGPAVATSPGAGSVVAQPVAAPCLPAARS